ncbi:hypothetical protein ACWO4B_003247 [Clostridium sporogenes]
MQQRNSSNKKQSYIILVLITVIVVSGFLTMIKITNFKSSLKQKDNKITELEQNNSNLSKNITELNETIEHNTDKKNKINLDKKYEEISNQFVEIYPMYDVKKVKEKKDKLLSITNETVANSIVPDDMIKDSKKLQEGTKGANQLYSTDPTFKSYYDSSKIYKEYVTANKVNYFAILKYKTKSSSGDTENITYLSFTIENKNKKMQVTEYQIYYLKQ